MPLTSPYASRRIQNPVFFLCDIQDKFRQPIHAFPHLLHTTQKFLRFCDIYSIPLFVTTQQRAKLGDVCQELGVHDGGPYSKLVRADVDKTLFSMCVPDILTALSAADAEGSAGEKRDVILAGIETHICVAQTAVDLLQRGYKVFVLADGVSSCNESERGVALTHLRQEGARVVSSEGLMYEIMGDAGDERFKRVAGVVKEMKGGTGEAVDVLCRF